MTRIVVISQLCDTHPEPSSRIRPSTARGCAQVGDGGALERRRSAPGDAGEGVSPSQSVAGRGSNNAETGTIADPAVIGLPSRHGRARRGQRLIGVPTDAGPGLYADTGPNSAAVTGANSAASAGRDFAAIAGRRSDATARPRSTPGASFRPLRRSAPPAGGDPGGGTAIPIRRTRPRPAGRPGGLPHKARIQQRERTHA